MEIAAQNCIWRLLSYFNSISFRHIFFFFLNNSTPTVRMYCTVLYFTERTYFDLSSHQFDSYSTVRTYLRTYVFGSFRHVSIQFLRYVRTYRISYCTEARKFLIFETFKNHFIDTVSNFILQNCTSLISNPSYCTVPYQ